jgi:uncharacterized cupredoxin-like copper-binding protein
MIETLTAAPAAPLTLTWRRLLYAAALVDALILCALIVTQRDLLALALTSIIAAGLALWLGRNRLATTRLPGRRWLGSGLPGLAVLGLVFADIAVYTLTGALSNLLNGEAFLDLATPASLAVASLTGLAAAVATGLSRGRPQAGARGGPALAGAGVVALATLLLAGLLVGRRPPAAAAPSALRLETANMAFSSTDLSAAAGEVTLRLSNSDLFWHTFTIDALGVNVQAPVGGERELSFSASPGVYDFYCAIPGHALIGMRGTLTVR